MNCPSCNKEVVADKLFCTWCEAFIPNPQAGKKAGLFRRWFATAIDPLLGIILYLVIVGILGGAASALGGEAAVSTIVMVTIGYGVFFLWFLSKGMTPGKWILGEQVVERLSGNYPGFGRMLLRETIGKIVSGLFLGLGYFWAIWDKDNQAWHDKIAGTVVVRRPQTGSQNAKWTFVIVAVTIGLIGMVISGYQYFNIPSAGNKNKTGIDRWLKTGSGVENDKPTNLPVFELIDGQNGTKINSSAFRGKAILLAFWSSWDSNNSSSSRFIERIYNATSTYKNFIVLPVLHRDNLQDALNYLRSKGYTYPVYFNPRNDVSNIFGVVAVPETILIDRNGTIKRRYVGPVDDDATAFLLQEIQNL